MLISVKMPTIVGILTFMNMVIVMLSRDEHEIVLLSWGPGIDGQTSPMDQSVISLHLRQEDHLSRDMRFPTMWYVRPAKAQISLRIRAVWSEPLLVTWMFHDSKATDRTPFGVSKLKGRLHRLIWVYTCQNTTLLEITCRGSFSLFEVKWNFPKSFSGHSSAWRSSEPKLLFTGKLTFSNSIFS